MRPAGALADPTEAERRRTMLALPHMQVLSEYVRGLNARGLGWAPDFDPRDGGVNARLLLLLEKPGPGLHSGFVSRDNDTPTARTIRDGMEQAKVPRDGIAIWNMVPWWNGTTAVRAAELRAGAGELGRLVRLLPRLCRVILAGNAARRASPMLQSMGLHVFSCVHPSPNARAGPASAAAWRNLPEIWRDAWDPAQQSAKAENAPR